MHNGCDYYASNAGHNNDEYDDDFGGYTNDDEDETHGVKSRWALQQDRLYFNNKIFVFNATTQQVGLFKYFNAPVDTAGCK